MRGTVKVLVGLVAVLFMVGAAGATAATVITGKQIKDGSITGKDVKDKSLTAKDFNGSVTGARGPQGAPGPAGQNAATPTIGMTTVQGDAVDVGHDVVVTASVNCPAGLVAIGGGGISSAETATLASSFATPAGTGWSVVYRNDSMGGTDKVRAQAVCAKVG